MWTPQPEAEWPDGRADRPGGTDGAGGAVERGEEPVAGRVPLLAAEARELPAGESVVLREQISPPAVAKLGGPLGRADDVGEEQCCEHALRDLWQLLSRQAVPG